MKAFYFVLSCLAVVTANSDFIYKPTVNGVKFGDHEDFWQEKTQKLKYIQEDLVEEGNLLVLTEDVFGSLDKQGNFEVLLDFGDSADAITCFVHHNDTAMIFVDEVNNCLRWFNRETRTLSHMAGECAFYETETMDGNLEKARFRLPTMIIMGRNNTEYFLIEATSNSGGILRNINLSTGQVAVLLGRGSVRVPWSNPLGMAVVRDESDNFTLYIACKNDIYAVGITHKRYGGITSGKRGLKDGDLKDSSFVASDALVALGNNILLALPSIGKQLRVIDLQNEFVSSLNLSFGSLGCVVVPSQKRIYFAGSNNIHFIPYEYVEVNGARKTAFTLTVLLLAIAVPL